MSTLLKVSFVNVFFIRSAYLDRSDVNVIILDWRRLALSTYTTSVRGVPAVGKGLGQFLTFLNQVTGAPFELMHLIGFSLGAHLVGNAGRELSGRVARVTGKFSSSFKLPLSDAIYSTISHGICYNQHINDDATMIAT